MHRAGPTDSLRNAVVQRPRIGLVLGGGGARGGAHVGVLRVLEELRIPVDAIAGTSMGAIVGALYASGMSVDAVESALLDTDWTRILSVRADRRSREVRRKQDDPHLLVDFELGYRDGRLRVPGGIIGAHGPALLLETLLLPVAHIRDYDELPIPFRAVATDIVSGEPVVLRAGTLARSVRASMSIPGAFPAVAMDGRLLVDGGVVRNLPVEIIREMNVDVVIAVDVGTPLQDTTSLHSAFGLLSQTMTLFTRANADAQLEHLRPGDLHLQPDVGDVGALDFHRIAQAIAAGDSAARAARDALVPFSLPEAEYRQLLESRRLPEHIVVVDSIRVEPVQDYASAAIAGRLLLQPGDTLRVDVLTQEVERVYALGVFQQVDFDVTEHDGNTVLVVRPVQKPWGPNFLRLGFGLLNGSEGRSRFDLTVNVTMTGIGGLDADFRNELQLGEQRRIFSEYFQPLSVTGRFFIAPSAGITERTSLVDNSEMRLGEYDVERLSVGLDVGSRIGAWGQFRLGVQRVKIDAEPNAGVDGPEFENSQTHYAARLIIDALDDVAFPSAGQFGQIALTQVDVSARDSITANHSRVEADLLFARTAGPHTLLAGIEGRASIASPLPVYDRFPLGGLFHMSGLEPDDISGDAVALARVIYLNRTSSVGSFDIAGGLRFGGSFEVGNAWNYREASLGDLRIGGSGFVALDTLLGPLYFAYGLSDRGNKSWYILLGPGIL
jgi:NTE family protein